MQNPFVVFGHKSLQWIAREIMTGCWKFLIHLCVFLVLSHEERHFLLISHHQDDQKLRLFADFAMGRFVLKSKMSQLWILLANDGAETVVPLEAKFRVRWLAGTSLSFLQQSPNLRSLVRWNR